MGGPYYLLIGTHEEMIPAGAIRLARLLQESDPLWFEEPTTPGNIVDSARVIANTLIPVSKVTRPSIQRRRA